MSVSPFNTLSGAGAIERYKAKKKKEKKRIVGISIEDMTNHSKNSDDLFVWLVGVLIFLCG